MSHELKQKYTHNDKLLENRQHNAEKETIEQLRLSFAKQLRLCIKRAYSGRIPSYSIIARDYALRSTNGGAVSAETIRKWMLGISVPQSSRLHTLIQWLGIELAEVLHLNTEKPTQVSNGCGPLHPSNGSNLTLLSGEHELDGYFERRILLLIKNLSNRDKNTALTILEALKESRNYGHE